ncbi:hypothetical protein N7520_004547 [Penicillium odoratum]|uniref:uncharacterized protein n=1 Tax=Penicillium odoratum TaxID=1167516 RepID=UPI00254880B3|nr:uncharacterized protein N7520_004547 [Penicillium odoratum]KAJ5764988.1 hypothetical protein N7520_004547 [Penicillium odoratum]
MTSPSLASPQDVDTQPSSPSERKVKIHILCPSFPVRFTLNELPLNTTAASLRLQIMDCIPTHPPPETQRLIFAGRSILASDSRLTLGDILGAAEGDEYTIHLALPPPAVSDVSSNTTSTPIYHTTYQAPEVIEYSSILDMPNDPLFLAHANLDAAQTASTELNGSSTLSGSSEFLNAPPAHWNLSADATPFALTSAILQQGAASSRPASRNLPFTAFQRQVELIEENMSVGRMPSLEQLFRLRSDLMQSIHVQRIYRRGRPHPGYSNRIRELEELLTRVLNIYNHIDGLIAIHPHPESTGPHVYIATSPEGLNVMIMHPAAMDSQPISWPNPHHVAVGGHNFAPVATQPTAAQPTATQPNVALRADQPNAADVVQNAVHQAIVNQPQRRNEPANAGAFVRHVRQVWLFIRLYFFIYMISESGTWTRVLFVTLAALIALLSDSQIPQRLYGMIVAPIQRHLEGLAHVGGPADQAARTTAEQNTNNQPGARPMSTGDEIREYLWRAERSVVLLLASLIPGIGERQVQARNAAEAERVRQAEERERERERERQREQEQAQQSQTEDQTQERT